MWAPASSPTARASYELLGGSEGAAHGQYFQRISHDGGEGAAGIANYGLNCQHGMHLLAGRLYEGFTFLRAHGHDMVSATVALHDWQRNVTLAETTVSLPVGRGWERVPLSLTPSENTTCGAMAAETEFGSRDDLTTCSGRLVISTTTPGSTLDVDLTVLAPGAWGTEPAPWAGSLGLPARRDVVQALRQQQLGVLRMGGTMCNVDGYRWKLFRGPRELRDPYRGYWCVSIKVLPARPNTLSTMPPRRYEERGLTQSRSFGMFETVDLCQAIECEPVITLNLNETAEDMGDFVEYCWGNTSTPWGAIRAADGHFEPYRVTIVEIGNEVDTVAELCPKAVMPIVRAMDERAEAVGAPLFSFVIGYNVWGEDVQDGTARRAALDACLDATASLNNRIFWDFHTEAWADTAGRWGAWMDGFGAAAAAHNSSIRIMLLEENAWPTGPADHGLARGIGHAAYSNTLQRRAGLVPVHGYANGLQAWQGMDPENAFPQGQLFVLPNATIPQAAYHVIQMIGESWLPYVLAVNDGWEGSDGVDALAVGSEDGRTLVVRIANWAGSPLNVTLHIAAAVSPGLRVQTRVLQGKSGAADEENTPGEPARVSPRDADVRAFEPGMRFELPDLSFTVLTLSYED